VKRLATSVKIEVSVAGNPQGTFKYSLNYFFTIPIAQTKNPFANKCVTSFQ